MNYWKTKAPISTLLTGLLTLIGANVFAQEQAVEMADAMRSNGKIYVVVCVIAVIFVGIILYLIQLDKKISKLEKNKTK